MKTSSGFLTTTTHSAQLPVGTQTCPWMIRAQAGQQINLTLYSFYIPDRDLPPSADGGNSNSGGGNSQSSRCLPHRLVVLERNRTMEIAVCSEKRRERHLYTSDGNEVNVYIHSNLKNPPPARLVDGQPAVGFLVRYQSRIVNTMFNNHLFFQNNGSSKNRKSVKKTVN